MLVRGVIRVKKQPLVAKAIENDDHQSTALSVERAQHGGDQ